MQEQSLPRIWRALGAGAVLALVILSIRFLPFQEYGLALLETIQSWGPLAPVICVAVYVVWVLCLLPGSVMTVGAGVMFGTWGIPVAVAGGMASSTAAFLIARYWGRARIREWTRRSQKIRVLDRALQESGWVVVLLSRLSPIVPYNVSNYFFGITSISFGAYFTATLAGMLPGTVLYAYAGSLGHKIISGEEEIGMVHYVFLAGGIAATAALGIYLQKKLKRAAAQLDEEEDLTSEGGQLPR